MDEERTSTTRRQFVKTAASSVFALTVVPRHVLGGPDHIPPSEKLNIAAVGCGGKGESDIRGVATGNNIVALCDVDEQRAHNTFKRFPKAKRYKDWRVMLEKEKTIDAVTVSTPDHVHGPAALAAIQLGKHVYVQKPLTRTIYEARQLLEASRRYKVATQMGNQGHASDDTRKICEWIWQGAVGTVKEVHWWTNRPIWPQGIERPTETPPVPPTLDWNLWLGFRPWRPYNPAYCPFKWRGWWDFGSGALGDMGCHIMDAGFWALDLARPLSVEAESFGMNVETFPKWSIIRYQFPAHGKFGPLTVTWYDGGKLPPLPPAIEEWAKEYQDPDRKNKLPTGANGQMYVGDKGVLVAGTYGGGPKIYPQSRMDEFLATKPKQLIERTPGHYEEWLRACKGGKPASGSFEHAVPLTKLVLLGNQALLSKDKLYGTLAHGA